MAKAARRMVGISTEIMAVERLAALLARESVSGELDDRLTLVRKTASATSFAAEAAAEAAAEGETQADLLATIHERIIPQLMAAHLAEAGGQALCPDGRIPPTREEIAEFSRIAVAEDLPGALAFIESLVSQGLCMETVLLQLVAEAARLLGEDWMADLRGFAEVALALGTLQQVIHVLGPSFAPDDAQRGSVVLVSVPSEQHTLGVYLLGEFLRRAGWGVQVEPQMPRAELILLVESTRVDMVGISLSNMDLVEPLARLIKEIKTASINVDIAIMIGGARELESHAENVGATFCNDPRDAVRWLDRHVSVSRKARIN